MPVGKMDILLNIEMATEARSGTTGQLAETWSTWNTVFAEIVTARPSEGEKINQVTATDERVFRIRYIAGVSTKMRLHDPEMDRYYAIKGITAEGRKNYLLITAKSLNVNPAY